MEFSDCKDLGMHYIIVFLLWMQYKHVWVSSLPLSSECVWCRFSFQPNSWMFNVQFSRNISLSHILFLALLSHMKPLHNIIRLLVNKAASDLTLFFWCCSRFKTHRHVTIKGAGSLRWGEDAKACWRSQVQSPQQPKCILHQPSVLTHCI